MDTKTIKGNIACSGIAQGKAVIIKTLADLDKVKQGDILVSQKTIPAMIISMQKCAGIITDTGGITSHAAIVSREFQKPCLVGTNDATTTFCDDDLIFLDANQGIATKIDTLQNISKELPKESTKTVQSIKKGKINTENFAKLVTVKSKSKTGKTQAFLTLIKESFQDYKVTETWPLNAIQITAYFDIDEALEMYQIYQKLKEKKQKEIATFLPPPVSLKYALTTNGIIGLKIAQHLKFKTFTVKEKEDFLLFWLDQLQTQQHNSIFDNTTVHLLNIQQVSSLLKQKFVNIKNTSADELIQLITTADALIYSLYYDVFISAGLQRHGPYDVSTTFGPGTEMVIFDYYDLAPDEIWDHLNQPMHKTLRIAIVYQNCPVQITFLNRFIAPKELKEKIVAYFIDTQESLQTMTSNFHKIILKQNAIVESLSDQEKVRKGALIYHYQFRKMREKILGYWKPKYLEETLHKFGDKFIKEFKNPPKTSSGHYIKLFDPKTEFEENI